LRPPLTVPYFDLYNVPDVVSGYSGMDA